MCYILQPCAIMHRIVHRTLGNSLLHDIVVCYYLTHYMQNNNIALLLLLVFIAHKSFFITPLLMQKESLCYTPVLLSEHICMLASASSLTSVIRLTSVNSCIKLDV